MAALFVIDIQRLLVGESPHGQRVVDATNVILEKVREVIDNKAPEFTLKEIVFVQHHETPEDGPLLIGTPEWELVVKPRENHPSEFLVAKTDGNTFKSNPNLADQLRSRSINSIYTLGFQSQNCVRCTSEGASKLGFKTTILSGAHSTNGEEGKTAEQLEMEVEEELRGCGVQVLPWEQWHP